MNKLTAEHASELYEAVKLFVSQPLDNPLSRGQIMEVARIALEALTAKPVEYLTWHQGCRAPDDCEIYTAVAKKGDMSDDGSDAFPVYMVPPVPEIKLPAKADSSNLPFAAMSWNACLDEVKRLNGVSK